MSKQESKKEENIEVVLGAQLGSNSKKLLVGEIDVGVMGVINEGERVVIPYFRLLDEYNGGHYCKAYFDIYEGHGGAVDGIARKQAIQAIGASRGNNASNIVDKPGIVSRVLNPNWKGDLEAKGLTVRE